MTILLLQLLGYAVLSLCTITHSFSSFLLSLCILVREFFIISWVPFPRSFLRPSNHQTVLHSPLIILPHYAASGDLSFTPLQQVSMPVYRRMRRYDTFYSHWKPHNSNHIIIYEIFHGCASLRVHVRVTHTYSFRDFKVVDHYSLIRDRWQAGSFSPRLYTLVFPCNIVSSSFSHCTAKYRISRALALIPFATTCSVPISSWAWR